VFAYASDQKALVKAEIRLIFCDVCSAENEYSLYFSWRNFMVLFHLSLFSDTLMMDTSVTIIFPQNCTRVREDRRPFFLGSYKVLYLLHYLKQNETSWIRMSSIERYVSQLPLVVVMPSVHRSFYTDQERGFPYFTYVADELPALMKEMFNISD
jgi:S-formylglutathione hydrolase FrmB